MPGPLLSILINLLPSIPAYLDPGSGSLLIQLLIAGIAGIGIFLGASWSRIRNLFRKKKQDPQEKEDDD